MIKKFKYSLILMTTLALSGCFDKDIKIQKTAISDSGIELTEGFEFQKMYFY